MLLTAILMLIAGLVLLVFAGDYLVRGAVGLAENLGISPLIIGLTIVALGTSLPELFVSVQAAFAGAPGLAIGNVVGSNTANILMVLGAPALIAAVSTTEDGLKRSMAVMLIVTGVAVFVMQDGFISRLDGAVLFAILVAFLVSQFMQARAESANDDDDGRAALDEEVGEPPHDAFRIALYILGGLIALPIAANLTVSGASDIARSFGVSETVIGLTIVAIGTSLPELATSVMAAIRKSAGVAIGNVVGSNIFNLAGILGLTALIIPLGVPPVGFDLIVMGAVSVLLVALALAKININRPLGALMIVGYGIYLWSVF